jgi:glycosyltransferase involved in cell wall biosynthesis
VKVAILVPGGVDRSGTERVIPCLLWLVERLAASDQVHIFALSQVPRPGRWPLLGATVHNAGARPRRLRSLAQMIAEHRRGAFDVVHAWWAAGPGAVGAAFSRITKVPLLVTLPGGDLVAFPEIGYGARLSATGRMWTRFALSAADLVSAPSEWMRQEALGFGIDAIRLPLGVALDRWPVSPPRRRDPLSPIRLVHVANLNPIKDQSTLLLAMAQLRERGVEFELDVVGFDTLGGAVQRQCSELGIDGRVRFHGFLPQPSTRPLVEAADLLVMTSLHETIPMVLAEAAVAGVPTVGTAVGQIADWAPDAAFAVPVRDPAALAGSIESLGRDEERRLAVAAEAQRRAIAENADVTAARTRAVYESLRTQ